MRALKIIVLLHADLIPPPGKKTNAELENVPWRTEYDVMQCLSSLGHSVKAIGLLDDLKPLREAIWRYEPDIVFNLLEEFAGRPEFDQHIVSFLELMDIPYTGCNPRGLMVSRDKGLAKKIMSYHQIQTPNFSVFPVHPSAPTQDRNKDSARYGEDALAFPMIVKCLNEEASRGISQSSIVHNEYKLQERVQYLHEKFGVDAIAEQFIRGREFFVGMLGNTKPQCLPIWELHYHRAADPDGEIYSEKAKFSSSYRKRKGITSKKARLNAALTAKIKGLCREAYQVLNLTGYCRFDLRLRSDDEVFLIEANPNPDIGADDEFALSAAAKGIKYADLLTRILQLGLKSLQKT
jgi:D-alanine-D-alanine ligase